MQRLYHIFRAFGTRALIPALTGGVFRPISYKKGRTISDPVFYLAPRINSRMLKTCTGVMSIINSLLKKSFFLG
jgi:hypothetical protein